MWKNEKICLCRIRWRILWAIFFSVLLIASGFSKKFISVAHLIPWRECSTGITDDFWYVDQVPVKHENSVSLFFQTICTKTYVSFCCRVSPCSSSQRNHKSGRDFLNSVASSFENNIKLDQYGRSVTIATQTTLVRSSSFEFKFNLPN